MQVVQDVTYVKELNLQEEKAEEEEETLQEEQQQELLGTDMQPVEDLASSTNNISLDNSKESSHKIHR